MCTPLLTHTPTQMGACAKKELTFVQPCTFSHIHAAVPASVHTSFHTLCTQTPSVYVRVPAVHIGTPHSHPCVRTEQPSTSSHPPTPHTELGPPRGPQPLSSCGLLPGFTA